MVMSANIDDQDFFRIKIVFDQQIQLKLSNQFNLAPSNRNKFIQGSSPNQSYQKFDKFRMKKTSTIRKLPRRETRKELRPYFKNPLQLKLPQELLLPSELRYLLKQQNISLRSIQEPLKKPQRSSDQLLKEIRQATQMQQNKLKDISKLEIKVSDPKKKVLSRKRISASTLVSLNQNSSVQCQLEDQKEDIQQAQIIEEYFQHYAKYEQEDKMYNFDTFKDQDHDQGWKNINVDRLIYFLGQDQQKHHCEHAIDFLHQ